VTVEDGQLARAVDRLVNHVGHWSPGRWAARSRAGAAEPGFGAGEPGFGAGDHGQRRSAGAAEVVHALAQRLADLEAEATGRPGYVVPWLDNALALPDQVRVMALDLVWAKPAPEVLAAALDAVERAHREL
jgi:hypothetical protein